MADGLYINEKEFKTFDELSLDNEIALRSSISGTITDWFNFLPDPDPVLRKLGKSNRAYEDLMADDQVGSTTIRLKNGVKSLEWFIKPGEASDKEVKICKDALANLKQHKHKIKDGISQSLNAHFWGMTVFEVVWEKVDNNWLPAKLLEKPLEWFDFDSENNLRLRTMDAMDGIPLTGNEAHPNLKYRFILLQNEPTYKNPYGDKALSRCFWPVTFKRGGLKFFSVFVEKFGMPHVEIRHPSGWKDNEIADLVTRASMMIQDAVIAVPEGNSVNLHKTGEKQSGDLYKMYIDMCNSMIDKSILTNALSTEQQSKGGYSSANAGNEIVYNLAKQLKDFPEELYTELFRMVVELNIGSGNYPEFTTYEEDDAKKEFADRDKTLSESADKSGQIIKRTKSYYINNFGYKADEFDLVDKTPEVKKEVRPSLTEFSETSLNDLSNDLFQEFSDDLITPILKLASECKDNKEFGEKLFKLYPEMDSKKFEEVLTKVLFIKELQGMTDANEELTGN